MRQRDHDRAIKEIRQQHNGKVNTLNEDKEKLAVAIEYRSELLQAYEDGIYAAMVSPTSKTKTILKALHDKISRARKAYGEGASIETVKEILSA